MLGIRTWGRRMVSADKTTELWLPLHLNCCSQMTFYKKRFATVTISATFILPCLWFEATELKIILIVQDCAFGSNGPDKNWLRSPGLVVMGGDSCSKGHEFESWHRILHVHFSHLFVVKNVMFDWKDKNKWKRGLEILKQHLVPTRVTFPKCIISAKFCV